MENSMEDMQTDVKIWQFTEKHRSPTGGRDS